MSRQRGAKCTISYEAPNSLFSPFVGGLPSLGRPAGPSGLSGKWELFNELLSFGAMRRRRPRRQNGEIWRLAQLGCAAFRVRTMRARGLKLGTASGGGARGLGAARRAPTPGLRLGFSAPARPLAQKSMFWTISGQSSRSAVWWRLWRRWAWRLRPRGLTACRLLVWGAGGRRWAWKQA